MYAWVSNVFEILVKYGIILLEFIGSVIIVGGAIRAVVNLLRGNRENLRLHLGEAIALALEFKLGSEVLRTVVVRDMSELLVAGAIVVLRAAMTFLIHWEIKNEKAESHEKQSGGKKD